MCLKFATVVSFDVSLKAKPYHCFLDVARWEETRRPRQLPNTTTSSCSYKENRKQPPGRKYEEVSLFLGLFVVVCWKLVTPSKASLLCFAHIQPLQWEHLPNKRASLNSRGTIALI